MPCTKPWPRRRPPSPGLPSRPTSPCRSQSPDFSMPCTTGGGGLTCSSRLSCAPSMRRLMKAQTPRCGRIINNGSISAHVPRPRSIAYTATKHAITGLTKSLALDGREFDIACGQIDIGNAATEMTEAMSRGVAQANGTLAPEPTFEAQHVADAVLYMAGLPLDANVQFLTMTATKMPFIGRG